MIIGVGNDLLKTARIEKSMENKRFLEFCFSSSERAAFCERSDAAKKLAGCFAAKEALGKALGTGVRGFSLSEVSVLRDELGKPYFVFSGAAKALIDEKKAVAHLALSNTEEFVTATVILEEKYENI